MQACSASAPCPGQGSLNGLQHTTQGAICTQPSHHTWLWCAAIDGRLSGRKSGRLDGHPGRSLQSQGCLAERGNYGEPGMAKSDSTNESQQTKWALDLQQLGQRRSAGDGVEQERSPGTPCAPYNVQSYGGALLAALLVISGSWTAKMHAAAGACKTLSF